MQKMRLALCTAAFAGWLAYLGVLVWTRPQTADGKPLVVSHPQVLGSLVDVIATLPSPPGKGEVEATVVEVLYPQGWQLKPGDKILVSRLEECRRLPMVSDDVPLPDWSGSGDYLLLLRPIKGKPDGIPHFEVSPIPPSPGFSLSSVLRIYPATAESRAQYEQIEKP
jgi:hypothetical protein